jgi:hypothetical protein
MMDGDLICPRGHEFYDDEGETCPCGLPGYRSESEAKAAAEDITAGEGGTWATGNEPLVRAQREAKGESA